MKRSLFLPWLRSWSRRSYVLHGILIAQMILLPCFDSYGHSIDNDPGVPPAADPGNNDGNSTGNDPEPPNPPLSDPEPPTPDPEPEPPLNPQGDADGDGLNNADEAAADSNPYNPDTDGDHISDQDEITLTGTDPTSTDSNSDGISDYNEFYGNTSVDEDLVGPGETPYDHDGDGINDPVDPDPLSATNDPDSDGDYVTDSQDSDPTDPTEWNDTNNNGTNDDAEVPGADLDGDGISNETDSHPADPYLSNDWNYNASEDQDEDWDGDGVSNLQDSHPNSNCLWCDRAGNGVNDDEEAGLNDSDGDSVADNADSHPANNSLWNDLNGNGTNDSEEGLDSDTDSHFDFQDSHPNDASLWEDWNFNGTNDSQEDPPPPPPDSDGDSYADDTDSDPNDPSLWDDRNRNGTNDSQEEPPPPPPDSDGDSYPDGPDSDPSDSNLWEDGNRNGYNDSNEDYFIDRDGDGHVNAYDTHPDNASVWSDGNGNGTNDDEEGGTTITDTDGDGYSDESDTHANDPNLWNDHNNNNTNDELELPPDRDGDGVSDDQDSYPDDYDNDGLTDADEIARGTNPGASDSDNDGLSDGEEVYIGTNPNNVDGDGDGLTDFEEVRAYNTDPLTPTPIVIDPPTEDNTGGDDNTGGGDNTGTPPAEDPPPSQASRTPSATSPLMALLSSFVKATMLTLLSVPVAPIKFYKRTDAPWATAANLTDDNNDDIPDAVADMYLPLIVTAGGDLDGDGKTNLQEYEAGTNMLGAKDKDKASLDFDGDGITDVLEEAWSKVSSNKLNKYLFIDAFDDPDGDGLLTVEELNRSWGSTVIGQDPAAYVTNPFIKSSPGVGTTFANNRSVPAGSNLPAAFTRSASDNYKALMDDGLLRQASRDALATEKTLTGFFTATNIYMVPDPMGAKDHLPTGYLIWLAGNGINPTSSGNSTQPVVLPTATIEVQALATLKTKLKQFAATRLSDTDGDLMPNFWEGYFKLNWRDSADASISLAKAGVEKNLEKLVVTPAVRSELVWMKANGTSMTIQIQQKIDESTYQEDPLASGSRILIKDYAFNPPPLPPALTARPAITAPTYAGWFNARKPWLIAFLNHHTWQFLNDIDPDHDGLVNADECTLGLNPNLADYSGTADRDLDGDGFTDAQELAAGTDAKSKTSLPKLKLTISGGSLSGRQHQIIDSDIKIQCVFEGTPGRSFPAEDADVAIAAPNNFTLLAALPETATTTGITTASAASLPQGVWVPQKLQVTTNKEGTATISVKLPHNVASFGLTFKATKAPPKSIAGTAAQTSSVTATLKVTKDPLRYRR